MVGNRIKALREELNLKQDELAKKIGVSPSAIGMYERNLREANDDIKLKMCNLFNCSMDYLTGKSDIRNPEKIDIDDVDVSFLTGVKGLNDTNKMIIQNTLEALLTKQEKDENNKKKQ